MLLSTLGDRNPQATLLAEEALLRLAEDKEILEHLLREEAFRGGEDAASKGHPSYAGMGCQKEKGKEEHTHTMEILEHLLREETLGGGAGTPHPGHPSYTGTGCRPHPPKDSKKAKKQRV